MIKRKPEGYKDLLVYQKAAELQVRTFELTSKFPKTKTFIALADQMDRSARSGTKNIIEGWMRNTTKEYFDFLGFSIGSVEELKDDAADIAKGLYRGLMTISWLWVPRGERGVRGEKGERGERGEKGERGVMGNPVPPLKPISPFDPIPPFQPFTEAQLTSLRFYPLDDLSLPLIVQLYLRAKEVLMLLNKLQQSLDVKMDEEMTRSPTDRARKRIREFEEEGRQIEKAIEEAGLVRLIDGRWIKREEWEQRVKRGEDIRLFGE